MVILGDLSTDNRRELYSVSVSTSGTQLKLTNTPVLNGTVFNGVVSPDGNRVTYYGDLITDNVGEFFAASTTTSGTQIKLNNTPVAGGEVIGQNVTPDFSRRIYAADYDTNDVFELYSASTAAAGTQIKLNSAVVAGGNLSNLSRITPDSARVIYRGDLTTDEKFELYSASTGVSGTQIKISQSNVAGGDVTDLTYQLNSDGSRAVFVGDLDTDEVFDLYSASTVAEGSQIRLSLNIASQDVNSFRISPNGEWVLFEVTDGISEHLWLRDIFGLNPLFQVTAPTSHALQVLSYSFANDGLIVFSADQSVDEQVDLYAVAVPEPSSVFGLVMGFAVLLSRYRRRL